MKWAGAGFVIVFLIGIGIVGLIFGIFMLIIMGSAIIGPVTF